MTPLTMSRWALLSSLVIDIVALLLGLLLGKSELLFLISIIATIAIAFSALTCVVLQIRAALR
jgi:hypothetical protein